MLHHDRRTRMQEILLLCVVIRKKTHRHEAIRENPSCSRKKKSDQLGMHWCPSQCPQNRRAHQYLHNVGTTSREGERDHYTRFFRGLSGRLIIAHLAVGTHGHPNKGKAAPVKRSRVRLRGKENKSGGPPERDPGKARGHFQCEKRYHGTCRYHLQTCHA